MFDITILFIIINYYTIVLLVDILYTIIMYTKKHNAVYMAVAYAYYAVIFIKDLSINVLHTMYDSNLV